MPSLKPVITLKNLCTSTVAEHLFSVFSSWRRSQDLTKLVGNVVQRDIVGSTMDYSDCYLIENEVDSECQSSQNITISECFLELLTNGKCGVEDRKSLGESKNSNAESENEDSECNDTIRSQHIPPLCEVPSEYQTVGDLPLVLASQVKEFLSGCLILSLIEDILAALINLMAQKIEIPRSTRNISEQGKNLQFINSLSFLLKVSLSSLLVKGVESLNLSSVSHSMLKLQSFCTTDLAYVPNDFDFFSYVLDPTLPGLRTLKYLHLPHCVQDDFVRKIAFLCPNLKILILRCCADIREPSINSCRNAWPYEHTVVTDLDALFGYGKTFKSPANVEFKLRGCKKLVSLALPWGLCIEDLDEPVTQMLLYMSDLKHYVGPPVRPLYQLVKHFHNCSPPVSNLNKFLNNQYQVSIVFSSDNTEGRSLTLSDMKRDSFEDLLKLPLHPKVKDLLIANVNVELDFLEMFPGAETIVIYSQDDTTTKDFKNLTSLYIKFRDMKELLSILCRTCPSLETLVILFPNLDMSPYDARREQIVFPSLRTLGIQNGVGNSLPTILSCCPALSCFEFSMPIVFCEEINDFWEDHVDGLDTATFHKTLPYLSKLRKFVCLVFMDRTDHTRTLTVGSLKALISLCPDLKYVGYLESWDISKEEFEALQDEIKRNNWDLELLWKWTEQCPFEKS